MFKWLKKDPVPKLQAAYAATVERARDAQRVGDIKLFADLTTEAEALAAQLDRAQQASSSEASSREG